MVNGLWFYSILLVDLAMSIFEFRTKFLIFWHPWHPWGCIHSVCWKWNLKQIEAIPPSVILEGCDKTWWLHKDFGPIVYYKLLCYTHWKRGRFFLSGSAFWWTWTERCIISKWSTDSSSVHFWKRFVKQVWNWTDWTDRKNRPIKPIGQNVVLFKNKNDQHFISSSVIFWKRFVKQVLYWTDWTNWTQLE